MILCGVQVTPAWEDPSRNLVRASRYAGIAARDGASLVCFPEQFTTGWDPVSTLHAEDVGGPNTRAYAKIARESGIFVIGSIRQVSEDGVRNTCLAFSPDGDLAAVYAKIHPFSPAGEDRYYQHGDSLAIFQADDLCIGMAICYDLRFGPLFQAYRDCGADAVIVPSAWPASRMQHFDLFIRARACEQQMYVFGINTTGTTPVDQYRGGSLCIDPYGDVVIRAGPEGCCVHADISSSCVRKARAGFPVARDRRETLYPVLNKTGQRGQ